MAALRPLSLISGLTAAVLAVGVPVAKAQDVVPAPGDAAAPVDVTSSVINSDAAPLSAEPAAEAPTPDVPETPALDITVEATPAFTGTDLAPGVSLRPRPRDTWAVPAAQWDGLPQGPRWTAAVLSALRGPGAPLLSVVPRDINAWCPGYINAEPEQRAAFWTGLISTLAYYESTHNPRAVGGGGRWFGLVQIAPGTARWRDCDVQSSQALLNGAANLRCGIRIMGITVPRDQVVSEGMRGVAADWGPFHSRRKREEMRNWVRGQDYCLPPMRPVMRPAGLGNTRALEPVSGPGGVTGRPVQRPASG